MVEGMQAAEEDQSEYCTISSQPTIELSSTFCSEKFVTFHRCTAFFLLSQSYLHRTYLDQAGDLNSNRKGHALRLNRPNRCLIMTNGSEYRGPWRSLCTPSLFMSDIGAYCGDND